MLTSSMRALVMAAGVVAVLDTMTVDAASVTMDDGTLKFSGGDTTWDYAPATKRLMIRRGKAEIAGKAALLRLVPGKQGMVVRELGDAAKLEVSGDEALAARLQLQTDPVLRAVALLAFQSRGNWRVPVTALGFGEGARLAGYDLATDEFHGPFAGHLPCELNQGQGRILALAAADDRPDLLCTSKTRSGGRDLTQVHWDVDARILSGRSKVDKGALYELRLLAPPEPRSWQVATATVSDADREAGVIIYAMQTRQWLRVRVESPADRDVAWQLRFATKPPVIDTSKVELRARALSPRRVEINRQGGGPEMRLRRGDGAEFVMNGSRFVDTTAPSGTTVKYTVHRISWSHEQPSAAAAVEVKTPAAPPRPPLPEVFLSDVSPLRAVNGWNGAPRADHSIEDNPLRLRGEEFKRGMGVHAISELVYRVRSNYRRFVALVGVDDEQNAAGPGSISFAVYVDAKELFRSPILSAADEPLAIDVAIPKGAKQVRLAVGDGGDGIGCDHADWANAGFVTNGDPDR